MKLSNVDSSSIKALGWSRSTLAVVFINSPDDVYLYSNIPRQFYSELITAESVGKRFQTLKSNNLLGTANKISRAEFEARLPPSRPIPSITPVPAIEIKPSDLMF